MAGAGAQARAGADEQTCRFLAALAAVPERVLEREVLERPVLGSLLPLIDYLHATMAFRVTESARVLYLDVRNRLIRDELLSQGTIDSTDVPLRAVALRAMDLGSASLILVHNHPSGDPTPSSADLQLTAALVRGLRPLGIQIHDHIIIAASGHVSLRQQGRM